MAVYLFNTCLTLAHRSYIIAVIGSLYQLKVNIIQNFTHLPTLQVNVCDMYKSPSILPVRMSKLNIEKIHYSLLSQGKYNNNTTWKTISSGRTLCNWTQGTENNPHKFHLRRAVQIFVQIHGIYTGNNQLTKVLQIIFFSSTQPH